MSILLILCLLFPGSISMAANAPKPLTILTEEWPTANFEDPNATQSLAVDLVREIQKVVGNKDPIQVLPWARAYKMLNSKPNVILLTVARTKERENMFSMVGPVGVLEIAIFAKEKPPFKRLAKIPKDAMIAAMQDTIFHSAVEKAGFKNIVTANSHVQTVLQLNAGHVDFICEDSDYIKDLGRQHNIDISKIKKVYTIERRNLYIGFSKHTPDKVIAEWKDALRKLKNNGSFQKIHEKWRPKATPPNNVEVIGFQAQQPPR